ncbi:hypothetical protein PJF56_16525 [Roseofilum sp. BLCC_M91]|uniref:Uncharacterized protein n=1 Tax=Roseofilum halophilum BLCC-M91 TaxID=3022259 RepID=A0ABT7BN11_9CYAN|nr:hypothetical protein [Roseofilum halophilum]MDJ1180470.1 hypothetical protein [Roseofilum halophilum BLCC-M91]
MIFSFQRKQWVAVALATVVFVSGCAGTTGSSSSSSSQRNTPTQTQPQKTSQDTAQSWENTQRETTKRNAAPAVKKEALPGSRLNRFFPRSGDGYQVVAAQEKKGFSEYKLKQGGKDMAVLSISDTISLPAARKKYEKSTKNIGGFPAVTQGSNITGVLVADRFQVKAQSRDRSFTESDRQVWLQKFDLQGLSRLN